VTHISFAQWNDGAGAFYVDNVSSPAQQTNGGGGYLAANSSNQTPTSYMANRQYLLPVFLLSAVPVAFSLRKNKRKRK